MERNDERRRYYRLTSGGRAQTRAEAEKMAESLRLARAKWLFRGDYV